MFYQNLSFLVLLNWHEPLEIIREIFPNWKPIFYMRNSGKLKSKFILIMLLKHSRRMQEYKLFGYTIFIARRRSVTPKLRNCRIFRFQSIIIILLGQVKKKFSLLCIYIFSVHKYTWIHFSRNNSSLWVFCFCFCIFLDLVLKLSQVIDIASGISS